MFIDSVTADTAAGDANAVFTFPNGSVIAGEDNVITVLQDHMGNDEGTNRRFAFCHYVERYEQSGRIQRNPIAVFVGSSSSVASENSRHGRSKESSEATRSTLRIRSHS